jgi:RNA polymerase sigma factor for flagellar operon FliA
MLKESGSSQEGLQPYQEQLVAKALPLVRRMAFRLARRLPPNVEVDDLIGAGAEGLLRAVKTYDVAQFPDFEPYAKARIRGAILDELRASDDMTRYGRDRLNEMTHAIRDLQNELGRQPTESEIAERLEIPLEEYHRLNGDFARRPILRLAEPVEPDNVETDSPDPHSLLDRAQLRSQLASAIGELPEKSQQVLALYYQEECTQAEIGRILGVTNSRASQILSDAIVRLRALLDKPDSVRTKNNPKRRAATQ